MESLACQRRRCKRHGFNSWVRKISWGRTWQPTPVFLPEESHGQSHLVGYSSIGTQSRTRLKRLSMHTQCWVLHTGVLFHPDSDHVKHMSVLSPFYRKMGFPAGSAGKKSACEAGDAGSIPGLGRFPWRRKWQPTPVFLPWISIDRGVL